VKLKDLCLDPRPAVRKSAGQTLFNTIGSHGRHLQADTWRVVLWKVLFPLLESVSEAALAAAEADAKQAAEPQGGGAGGGGILMHHSRDTVGKQWAETQTLALAGVASVFHAQQRLLLGLNDFARAWKLLLECIEQSALSANSEIAQNALNSFQELANLDASADTQEVLWQLAWHSWLRIAQQGSLPRPGPPILVPSQDFLTSLCRLLPCLFNRVTTSFGQADFTQLSAGLSQALVCPILSDSRAPYILPTNYFDSGLTPLQESVIAALETLARAFLLGPESLRPQLPNFFNLLSVYANYAVHTPKPAKLTPAADNRPENFVSLSYVAFGERCFELMVDLYKDCASQPVVVRAAVLEGMYKALRQPLCIKYNCPSQSTWRLAYKCLTSLIVCGTPVARQHADHFSGMWDALAQAIEDFLFAPHKYPPGLTVEDFEEHEALDCALVTLVRDTFLSRPDGVPVQFVDRMIALLNRGSIHSVPVSAAASDLELHRWLREELAQLCFHTLLSYSFSVEANGAATGGGGGSGGEARGAVSRAAVRTILTRCRDVLRKFVDDQRLSGHCPLPRARLTEVGLSLKALSSLLTAFKAAPQDRVDPQAWQILLDTYPAVVEAVLPNCTNFLKPLKELLHLYSDLLRVPQSADVKATILLPAASSNPSGLAAANLPSPSRGLQQQQQLPPPPPPPLLSLRNCADMRPAIVQTADPIDEAPVLVTAADARLSSRGCRLSLEAATPTKERNLEDSPAAIFCLGTDGQALTRLPCCQQFVYLGGLVPDVREDLRRRRGLPWGAFRSVRAVLQSEALPDRQRVALFQAVIETVLLYNAETWTLTDSPEHWPASRRLQDRLRASHQSATLSQHWPAPSQQTVAPSATPAGRPFYPSRVVLPTADAEPTELEDRLLLSWRDDRVRSNLCRLRPCLNRLSACPAAKLIDQDRQLTFNAVDLLCGLTELQQAGGGLDGGKNSVPYCLEGVLDLLQYAYADVAREAGNASAQRVCDCVGRPGIPCPVQCRQIIYKLNCLYSQCRQHEQIHIARFPAWNWYFSKADALKSKYNVTFCERPIETAAAAEGKQAFLIKVEQVEHVQQVADLVGAEAQHVGNSSDGKGFDQHSGSGQLASLTRLRYGATSASQTADYGGVAQRHVHQRQAEGDEEILQPEQIRQPIGNRAVVDAAASSGRVGVQSALVSKVSLTVLQMTSTQMTYSLNQTRHNKSPAKLAGTCLGASSVAHLAPIAASHMKS
uniref:Mon2_C domain-containing protein n=1 Tax=Macrostomum lignano TaxID=282301 RepID=A0A1I8I6F7_9PLAT